MRYDLTTPGGRLRFFREDRDLTQEALGTRAGVDQTSISYYERNAKLPRKGIRSAIAEALGVLPSSIWTVEDIEAAA